MNFSKLFQGIVFLLKAFVTVLADSFTIQIVCSFCLVMDDRTVMSPELMDLVMCIRYGYNRVFQNTAGDAVCVHHMIF